MNSLGFSSFRKLMDLWDEVQKTSKANVESIIDSNQLVFFFKIGKEIFGAPEEGRITFANIKHPNADDPPKFSKEASFTAYNLSKALTGDRVQSVFGKKDMTRMDVCSREEITKALQKQARGSVKAIELNQDDDDSPQPPENMMKIGDENV